jgi:hypothetical protein
VRVFNWGDDLAYALDELIPACPTLRTGIQDPREPQTLLRRVYGRRTSWKTDYEKGEMTVQCGDSIPSIAEMKVEAAAFRKCAPLQRIVLMLDPDLFREHVNELSHLKFVRDERREDGHSRAFVVVREVPPIRRKPSE